MMFRGVNRSQWSLALISIVWWTVSSVVALELGESCVNPLGEPGKCILFRECKPTVDIYNKPINTHEDTEFLMQSRCGVLQRKTLVCCATSSQRSSLPEPLNCGTQLSDRVVGGQPTQINEFPWTALIEFQKSDGSFGFHCGGTLINERYCYCCALFYVAKASLEGPSCTSR
uniref:CLIP domain-containing serine protease n=1 Tax=Anopheles funestus TaxID=62324 RepID=A0A4Y0BFJ7_ANOFN